MTGSLGQLMNSKETFIGYEEKNEIIRILSYEIENNDLMICRLAVNPENFRQGIAKTLFSYIFKITKVVNIKVSTGLFNAPAVKFYLKEGFGKSHESKIDELSIFQFTKKVHLNPG